MEEWQTPVMAPRLVWRDQPPFFFLPCNLHIYCASPCRPPACAMRNHHIYCAATNPPLFITITQTSTGAQLQKWASVTKAKSILASTYVFVFIEGNQHINWSSEQGLSITITQASWMPIQGCHDSRPTVLWAPILDKQESSTGCLFPPNMKQCWFSPWSTHRRKCCVLIWQQ